MSGYAISVWLSLYFDDVRIRARIAIEGAHPVVIERVRTQAVYKLVSHIADIQILVDPHVSDEITARRYV